jgi:hypothetical protein
MGRPAITSSIIREEHFVLVLNGHYEYGQIIQELLMQTTTGNTTYVFNINFVVFIHVKYCNNKLS